ncbi:MAG: glutathione S-transferase [Ramlibacter sp.]
MLTIHHLGISQSERVVWLCEELGIPYTLKHYTRDPVTRLAPPELRALHAAGTAPVMTDGDVQIAESGAIVQYIIARHGGGRLALPPEHADFANYLYWFHFANGNLQPHLGRNMVLGRIEAAKGHPVAASARERVDRALAMVDARLAEVPYLAGSEFTAADIMNVFTLTTMRYFQPWDMSPYLHTLAYLARIAQRPAYIAAMAKGDPGMRLLLT